MLDIMLSSESGEEAEMADAGMLDEEMDGESDAEDAGILEIDSAEEGEEVDAGILEIESEEEHEGQRASDAGDIGDLSAAEKDGTKDLALRLECSDVLAPVCLR
jgi:hypothetical protein